MLRTCLEVSRESRVMVKVMVTWDEKRQLRNEKQNGPDPSQALLALPQSHTLLRRYSLPVLTGNSYPNNNFKSLPRMVAVSSYCTHRMLSSCQRAVYCF